MKPHCLLAALLLAGCSDAPVAKTNAPLPPPRLTAAYQGEVTAYHIHIITDSESGDEYLVVSGKYHSHLAVAIQPLRKKGQP